MAGIERKARLRQDVLPPVPQCRLATCRSTDIRFATRGKEPWL